MSRALLAFFALVATASASLNSDLREAAAGGDLATVQKLLSAGADPNAKGDKADDAGETPLHLACIGGNARVITALLKAGAHPNARATGPRSLRMTPITWCAYGGHDAGVEALLRGGVEGGADPNLIVDEESGLKLTALDIAGRVGDELGGRPLRTKALLLAAGAKTAAEQTTGASSPAEVAQQTIRSADVVVFSKTYCPFCKKTKALFDEVSFLLKLWVCCGALCLCLTNGCGSLLFAARRGVRGR